jgi:hypothetical protein
MFVFFFRVSGTWFFQSFTAVAWDDTSLVWNVVQRGRQSRRWRAGRSGPDADAPTSGVISQRDRRQPRLGRREEVLDVESDNLFFTLDRGALVSGSVTVADWTIAAMNQQRRRQEYGIGYAVLFQIILLNVKK